MNHPWNDFCPACGRGCAGTMLPVLLAVVATSFAWCLVFMDQL